MYFDKIVPYNALYIEINVQKEINTCKSVLYSTLSCFLRYYIYICI